MELHDDYDIKPTDEELVPDDLNVRANVSTQLAIDQEKLKPKRTIDEQLPEWLKDYKDVFEPSNFDELPPHRSWDHAIDLTPDAPAYTKHKLYSMSPNERVALDEFIDENLKTGRIRPSNSPYAAPFFFRDKKDGKLRPIQDYRELNSYTIRNRYPLPLISDIIDKLKGAKYFTKMDVRWGYNNVHIKEGDEWKAAFLTTRGLFEPTVMFFGLTNSPPTFQSAMDTIFIQEIREGWLVIYMDDTFVFGKDLEQHRQNVRKILQRFRENNLFLKIEKCEFEKKEVEYLGLIISENTVKMDPLKTSAVADWPIPKTLNNSSRSLVSPIFIADLSKDIPKSHYPSINSQKRSPGIGQKNNKMLSKSSKLLSLQMKFLLSQTMKECSRLNVTRHITL